MFLTALAIAAARPAAAADASATKPPPALRIVSVAPLTVAGSGFHVRERVRVTTWVDDVKIVRGTRATRAGRFRVTFADTVVDRCSGGFVVAVGARGARAAAKLPQPMCPPSLEGVGQRP